MDIISGLNKHGEKDAIEVSGLNKHSIISYR